MNTRTAQVLIAFLVAVIATPAFAATVTFGDSVIHWPTWPGHSSYGYNDDALDVVGNPNISGGAVTIGSDGYLKSVAFNYTVHNQEWNRLIPGSLFINTLSGSGDTTWDFVVTTMGAPGASSLAAGPYGLYSIAIQEQRPAGFNPLTYNGPYILSGRDVTGIWAGYVIRDNHPIGVKESALGLKAGDVYYSGFPNTLPGKPSEGLSFFDFTNNGKAFGLDLAGKDFILSWGPTCANDVVYETINNPVPEPSTYILFSVGIISVVLLRRRIKTC